MAMMSDWRVMIKSVQAWYATRATIWISQKFSTNENYRYLPFLSVSLSQNIVRYLRDIHGMPDEIWVYRQFLNWQQDP